MHLYTAAHPHTLAQAIAERIRRTADPFVPHVIVSGHYANNAWLTEYMARQNGIVAHLHFKTPEAFVDMVYQVLEAGPPKSQLLQPEQMVWIIDSILQDGVFDQLKTAGSILHFTKDPVKRHTMAVELAHCFEGYQETAPELLARWSAGEHYTTNSDEAWQRLLWNAVKMHAGTALRDVHDAYIAIKAALNNPDKLAVLKQKVPNAYFFGHFDYTEALIDLLEALRPHIDIRLFVQALPPTQANHPLTSYLGADVPTVLGRFTPTLLPESGNDPATPHTLLHHLQRNLEGVPTDAAFTPIDTDESLVIANVHSPFREVDALYHYLVRQLDHYADLKPSDVCVVVPDVSTYAPALETIFNNPDHPIPFTLYGHSSREEASPFLALLALLNLTDNGLYASEVLQLLQFDAVRRRFGFPEDCSGLRNLLDQAAIRQGYRGEQEKQTDLVSWMNGLTRLLYGACLPPDSNKDICTAPGGAPFLPVTIYETTEDLGLILRLYECIERLHTWMQASKQDRTLSEWVQFLDLETMEVFIDVQDQHATAWSRLLSEWASTAEMGFMADKKFSFQAVRINLRRRLTEMQPAEKIGAGGVRITAPSPYLSAPVRVYAMLGLQADAFPRRSKPSPLDLSAQGADGTASDDPKAALDKQTFLQLLRNAQDTCYLSHIGRNHTDNSTITSSPVLRALEQTLETLAPDGAFRRNHPPSPYDQRYNQYGALDTLYRYGKISSHTSTGFARAGATIPKEKPQDIVIQLHQFMQFLNDPIKYYYNNSLGIYLNEAFPGTRDAEIISLSHLEKWQVKDQLTRIMLQNGDAEGHHQLFKLGGQLPLKALGETTLQPILKDLETIWEALKDYCGQDPQSVDVDHKVADNIRIQGTIEQVYDKTLLMYTLSSDPFKLQLEANIKYMLLKSREQDLNMNCIFFKKNRLKCESNPTWLRDENWLKQLCTWYINYSDKLIPLVRLPNNSFEDKAQMHNTLLQELYGFNAYKYAYPRHAYQNGLFEHDNALLIMQQGHQDIYSSFR
jgi:exodeoxyribonuclease V gamma subunit